MAKVADRRSVDYWVTRLFRNSFTYQGERREVAGWCVKVQWRGRRRTVRLESEDRELAAREAMAVYEELQRGGWAAVEGWRAGSARGEGPEPGPQLVSVGPRKYVSTLNAGRTRECFAELEFGGAREFIALGTEGENEARLRGLEARAELAAGGWERVRLSWSREVTVAVFWQANPMACTYTTLLTFPATAGRAEVAGKSRGWRILIVEPDGSVRRALVHWLARSPAVAEVDGLASIEAATGGGWHLVMCHQDHATSVLRAWVAGAGPGGAPAELLLHGVFRDSDAIFASVSGVTEGYFLRRVLPSGLLEPLLKSFPEGPVRRAEWERHARRYFQNAFEPVEGRVEVAFTAGLTSRETDVLELLRRGCVDKEIAQELGISVWTVHSHLKRIFAKYGVRTRTEAVVRHLQK